MKEDLQKQNYINNKKTEIKKNVQSEIKTMIIKLPDKVMQYKDWPKGMILFLTNTLRDDWLQIKS